MAPRGPLPPKLTALPCPAPAQDTEAHEPAYVILFTEAREWYKDAAGGLHKRNPEGQIVPSKMKIGEPPSYPEMMVVLQYSYDLTGYASIEDMPSEPSDLPRIKRLRFVPKPP